MNLMNLEQQIFALVAKITGHEVQDLEPDLFLESDLGLDSIKTMELFNGLIQLIPEEQQGDFLKAVPVERLLKIPTLGELSQVTKNWLASQTLTPSVETASENSVADSEPDPEPQKIEKLEILDSQYLHLLSHWLLNSNSLFATIRLEGNLEIDVLWQSWKDLIARHPMLRSRFFIAGATRLKEYRLEILDNPTPPEIKVNDLRHLNESTQEKVLEEVFRRFLNWEWKLTEWPLHRFFVIRLKDSVYQLILANEHLVSDGLGNHVILRELMEIYRAKISGDEPMLPPPITPEDYCQLIQSMNSWQEPEAEKTLAKSLNTQRKDNYFWNPSGENLSSIRPKFANFQYRLGQALTEQLIAQTRELRLPFNSLLAAAFLRAVAKFDSTYPSFILQVPTSGRVYPGIDASNVVSSFAQNLGLTFERPQSEESWEVLLKRVHQEVQTGLANGHDRIQSRQMAITFRDTIALKDGEIPEHVLPLFQNALKSNLYIPFTGHTHIQNRYGSLTVTDYRAGGINAAGTIDILQEIFDDCLYLFASYDSGFFSESVIDSLMQEYITQLEELAALKLSLHQVTEPIVESQIDTEIQAILKQAATEICHSHLTDEDLDRDLEADLGMDSLELIRIITRVEKQLGKVDRQALLSCRTLREMAVVLSPKVSLPATQPSVSLEPNLSEIPYLEIIEQVRRTPNAIAILDGNTQITYEELHRLSNQVAHYLRNHGVKPGVLVGIMMRRSPLLWIGILGILKAGGAYVPLDPAYPAQRLQYMLNHAEIGILLTEHQLTSQLAACLTPQLPLHTLLFLDEGEDFAEAKNLTQISKNAWFKESDQDLAWINNPDDLMTVLYTSGSTGQPKGVMLNHRGYMNRLRWMQDAFQLTARDRVAQKTSCCFDISVWEIFWPLMVGATVCPVEREIVTNPWRLAEWMKDIQISVMHFVPSLFGEFLNALENESCTFPHLRWLVFSGEALPVPFIQRWFDQYGTGVGLANLYGPTEASIDVTAHIIPQRPDEQEFSIPIGKAIDNVYIVILDEQMQPVETGQLGELWIGGVQLAKGYLKDPQRTAAAFHPNPFAHIPGEYLYRTGDLAKELPDGSIDYHGRIDSQVKIRGFRIELGEIESVLNTHSAVREAAVVVVDYGSGQKRLVAGLAGAPIDSKELREHLAQRLPDYMIPHRFEWLASLPKNHNGKLDRKALLALVSDNSSEPKNQQTTEEYLPLGPAQRWLVTHFEPPYQWCGYTRFRYRDRLDSEIFNQALNLIVERHAGLRTRFSLREGQWQQQVIQPQESLKAEFYDGSHLNAEQRDDAISRLIQQTSETLRIDGWPLLKAIAIKINESCHEIIFLAHHLVSDMLSGGVVFQEFWKAYHQRLINKDFNFQNSSAPSYTDYVRLLIEAEKSGTLAKHVDYWKSQFPSRQSAFHIPFDHLKGANVEASAKRERFFLSSDNSNLLLRKAKQHYQANLYPLLLAPLYQLMANWSQKSWVVLSHRMHGRNLNHSHQFLGSVGNFAVNFPIGIPVNSQKQWENIVKQITGKFDEVPMNGITFDWVSDQLPTYLYPDNHLTPIRANYLGNRALPSSNLFEFVEGDLDQRLSPPEQKRTTLLEFFFSIINGTLHVEIEYSQNFHSPDTIHQLGEHYLELMHDMLAAMLNPVVSESSQTLIKL